jgi:antitoxin YefM
LTESQFISYDITYDKEVGMTTLSVSEARKRLYTLVDEVKETHEPVQIVGKRSSAILVADEDWRAIQETLYLISIPGMRESIQEGLVCTLEDCDEGPCW